MIKLQGTLTLLRTRGRSGPESLGVFLVGAGLHSTLGELAAKLLVAGKLQKVFVSRGRATA